MTAPAESTPLMTQAIDAARARRFVDATALAKQAVAADPALATSFRHENLLRMLAHHAQPEHVARLSPARLNSLVDTGWLHSLYAGIPVNADGDPIPWITYPCIDFLEPKIGPDWSVLEWGCGQSTLWWAPRVRRVVSIEDDRDWHTRVVATAPTNVTIHLREDDASYADLTGLADEQFDAVVVDGNRARNRCVTTALARAKPTGIIVFDNTDRTAQRDGVNALTDAGWMRVDFFGLMPAFAYRSCTSVFFKDPAFLARGPLPSDMRTSLGPTVAQVLAE